MAVELGLSVSTKVEFDRVMSSLKTVLDGLKVPAVDAAAPKRHGVDPKRAPSLLRLCTWLQETITDLDDQQVAVDAIRVLQDVVALRNQAQHAGGNLRTRAAVACSRLGLEYPIRDWGHGWDLARARAADAFDVIRRSVAAQYSG